MKDNNPFDKRLDAQRRKLPGSLHDAAVYTTDTLDIAWAAVQAVFEDKATPEHALTLLPILLARADDERQRRLDEIHARTADGSGTPEAPPEE